MAFDAADINQRIGRYRELLRANTDAKARDAIVQIIGELETLLQQKAIPRMTQPTADEI